jgi:hypothetical protein
MKLVEQKVAQPLQIQPGIQKNATKGVLCCVKIVADLPLLGAGSFLFLDVVTTLSGDSKFGGNRAIRMRRLGRNASSETVVSFLQSTDVEYEGASA